MARNDIEGGKETCPVVAHMGLVSRPVIPASVQFRADAGRSWSAGKGVSYRYGARGGPRGVCKTSWARAPFRRKNAENEVLPPVRKRILILCGRKKRLRLHFQRFCGPPCRSLLRSRCESSPHRPTLENSSPLFEFAEYAYPPTPTKSAATPTASPTAW